VESLALSTLADKTELYIALDYPLHEGQRAGYEEIKKYLSDIKGFKSVIIIERDKNFGAIDNFFKSLDEVFEKYDKVIISEDDNVFSTDFIAFVNKGLNVYESRADIFSISGYQYPVKVPKSYKEDVYIWTGFSAWGVGIWKEKWEKIDWKYPELKSFLDDKENIRNLNIIADHYVPALRRIIDSGNITGDSLICHHLFIHGLYSVFPVVSRVRNMGNDGSGVNCTNLEKDIYGNQEIYDGNSNCILPIDIEPESSVFSSMYYHFKVKIKTKIKKILKVNLSKLGLVAKLRINSKKYGN